MSQIEQNHSSTKECATHNSQNRDFNTKGGKPSRSEFTINKAQNLIYQQSISKIDDSTYQVESSTPGKSYIIENGVCECLGFRYKKTCSHAIAAEILEQKTEDNN